MKSKLFPFPVCLLVFVATLCAPCAHAVQFRLIGWADPDSNLIFDHKNKAVETTLSPAAFSAPYEFDGKGELVLYKRVEHEGKIIRQTACTVIVPPGLQQGLLLLVPGDESQVLSRKVQPDSFGTVSANAPLAYNYVWFDDSLEARPSGTIQFLNLSPRQLALQVASQQLVLPPKAKALANLEAGSKRMNFQGAVQVDGRWTIFSRKPIPTRDPERMLVILREEPAPGPQPRIKLVTLFDWRAPAAPSLNPLPAGTRVTLQ